MRTFAAGYFDFKIYADLSFVIIFLPHFMHSLTLRSLFTFYLLETNSFFFPLFLRFAGPGGWRLVTKRGMYDFHANFNCLNKI